MEDKVLMILQMVQENKISAADAATLIQAVRDAEAQPAAGGDSATGAAAPPLHSSVADKFYADIRPFIPYVAFAFWFRLLFGRR